MTQPRFYSIPRLAKRLGITPASIRDWIKRGHVEPPPLLPATGERAYPEEMAERIERWYLQRLLDRKTRGPGARARRQRALSTVGRSAEAEDHA